MREILFRGRTEDGLWAYGDLEHTGKNKPYWVDAKKIIPETVGQFTGLYDKNGKKIFEGDIVVVKYPKGDICCVGDVQFQSGVFGAEWVSIKTNKSMLGSWGQNHNLRRFDDDIIERIEVIGSIHDNPELLKVVEE